MIEWIVIGVIIIILFLSGIRIVRPTHRGIIERFGKYVRYADSGFQWLIPFIEYIYQINITEQMVDAEPQEIITKDKLNAMVDAQVYFKVEDSEEGVKASQYNVNNYSRQIVSLARTTLRNIIGTLTLNEANSERGKINFALMEVLEKETKSWGIVVVRTELKQIDPPKAVQETMNSVVIAENQKQAAIDFATATETKADGSRRAMIKEAEGSKQAAILEAEGKAKAFELINNSFTGNAQLLKKLDVVQASLEKNAKIILPEGKSLVNVIGNLVGDKNG